jgi:hypothetical protein
MIESILTIGLLALTVWSLWGLPDAIEKTYQLWHKKTTLECEKLELEIKHLKRVRPS